MRVSRAWLLTKKEWKESFNSPMPYIVLVLFFLLQGWFFYQLPFLRGPSQPGLFFRNTAPDAWNFFARLDHAPFSEEFKTGTIETLATLPLDDAEIVMGKYGAILSIWLIMVLFSLPYFGILIALGPPDFGQMAGGFFGTILLGAFYGSLGLLASSFTRSQVVGFLLGFLFCFAFFMVGQAADYMPGVPGQLLSFLGVNRHFEGFLKGVVDTRDILYFLSGTFLALTGTLASFNSPEMAMSLPAHNERQFRLSLLSGTGVLLVLGALIFANLLGNHFFARWDWTSGGRYSLVPGERGPGERTGRSCVYSVVSLPGFASTLREPGTLYPGFAE
jgi:ABC-2 type transport system permease protein